MILDQKYSKADFRVGFKYYIAISPPEGRLYAAPFISRTFKERLNLSIGDYAAIAIANNWIVVTGLLHLNGELHVLVRCQESALKPYKIYVAMQKLFDTLFSWFKCRIKFEIITDSGSIKPGISATSLGFARLALFHYFNKF